MLIARDKSNVLPVSQIFNVIYYKLHNMVKLIIKFVDWLNEPIYRYASIAIENENNNYEQYI